MLPGLDGLEVAKRLKSNPDTRHIPIIMLTGYTEHRRVVEARDPGSFANSLSGDPLTGIAPLLVGAFALGLLVGWFSCRR